MTFAQAYEPQIAEIRLCRGGAQTRTTCGLPLGAAHHHLLVARQSFDSESRLSEWSLPRTIAVDSCSADC